MAKNMYRVGGTLTISVFVDVEATSPEEAKEIADGLPVQGLCHYCTSHDSNGTWVTSGELDGEPQPHEDDEPIVLDDKKQRRRR